jgi:intracellular sulfur oxidation DsrE/DsrF family protein
MVRKLTFLLLTSFSVLGLAVADVSAQDRPGAGRGQGFRGGRGPGAGLGFGQGRRMANQVETKDKAAKSYDLVYPVIANHGGVVSLPNAAQQPRSGTKLLVDLTSGGDPNELNSGLEKVAKYLNIYAGGGAEPASVKIAVVFHGEATLAVLHSNAYAEKFETVGNPNLGLLGQLNNNGVELYVCGQSLISKGANLEDVAAFVKPAVSALTTVVNLQADGFAYVPIANSTTVTKSDPQETVAKAEERSSQHGGEHGDEHGPMQGRGMGRGPGAMPGMREDMTTLHAMFADREKIKRTVTDLADGAEAVTESDDEAIAKLLKEHVPAMEDRVVGNKPLPPMTFHPIFVQLIKHADDYTLTYEETEKGIKVRYQSDDPYVVMLVQEHAKLVSRFIKNGMEEIHAPYELPTRQ